MAGPLLLLCLLPVSRALKLAAFFNDGMVLQRAPQAAHIYGSGALQPGVQAFLSCSLRGEQLELQFSLPASLQSRAGGEVWQVSLPPQEGGTTCDVVILAENTQEEIYLNGVMFGDVWLCSGQSNMAFHMGQIFNATEEIEASAAYGDIRFTVLGLATSDVEETDISPVVPWSDSSDSAELSRMSAVCFLFARSLYDMMLQRGERLPLGLIHSSWGGTRVEAWSTRAGLESCGVEDHVDESKPQNSNSVLWNAMIAPLKQMSLTGFLWYQGEANTGYQRDLYNCTFPALIDSWREEFSNPEAPFGFVQLSTVKYGNSGLQYPLLRLHQTADYQTVPNPRMPATFMAVAVDTYDEENGIHPRYKAVVGERLAVAGLRVAYGEEGVPSQGPVVTEANRLSSGSYRLTYDQAFTYDDSELTGFFSCCGLPGVCRDLTTDAAGVWPAVEKEQVTRTGDLTLEISGRACQAGEALSLAYLWRQTPIQTPVWGAPIYGDDQFRLPSPPWIWPDLPSLDMA